MDCPQCGHPAIDHNDAGSLPIAPLPDEWEPAFIPPGQMCCYHRIETGGVENWLGRVCGCEFAPRGSSRYY